MKRNTAKILSLTAAIAMGAAVTPAAFASGNHGQQSGQAEMASGGQGGMMGGGQGGMMQMMQMMQKHRQMMSGMMGGSDYMSWLDKGATTEEKQAILQAKLAEFDANGDGSLSIEEFEALHSAAIRELMVDRFQALDNDGDGQVTAEEMKAPASQSGMMGGGHGGQGDMMGGGHGGQGGMMGGGHGAGAGQTTGTGNGMTMNMGSGNGAGNGAMMQDHDNN